MVQLKQSLYNSLGREKQRFVPLQEGKVSMYCCGPTVYDLLHVGNFRGAVFFNFVRNWFESNGFEVEYVYNFTDVDDKILDRAKEEGSSARKVAETYIDEFWTDYNALGLGKHSSNPRVTEHMDTIIRMIEKLIEKGHAYEVEGEVFYSVRSFDGYGKLGNRKLDELQSGSRIEVDPKKKDPMDFTLWKPAKDGEEFWTSPWGDGRPGWHIECSAMCTHLLGPRIDIHGGGLDLVFPHHENEIAQSEGTTGEQFASVWMHNNMFNFGGQKMSKSLGNVRTMRSFLDRYPGEVFKFLTMSVHYRSVTDFSEETIHQSISNLARIYSALALCNEFSDPSDPRTPTLPPDLAKEIDAARVTWRKAMQDDFNTPEGFSVIFGLVRLLNGKMKRGMDPKPHHIALAWSVRKFLVEETGKVLALLQEPPVEFLRRLDDLLLGEMKVSRDDVDQLIQERRDARDQKDYVKSDELRDRLVALKISIQDTPSGTYWEVQK